MNARPPPAAAMATTSDTSTILTFALLPGRSRRPARVARPASPTSPAASACATGAAPAPLASVSRLSCARRLAVQDRGERPVAVLVDFVERTVRLVPARIRLHAAIHMNHVRDGALQILVKANPDRGQDGASQDRRIGHPGEAER